MRNVCVCVCQISSVDQCHNRNSATLAKGKIWQVNKNENKCGAQIKAIDNNDDIRMDEMTCIFHSFCTQDKYLFACLIRASMLKPFARE